MLLWGVPRAPSAVWGTGTVLRIIAAFDMALAITAASDATITRFMVMMFTISIITIWHVGAVDIGITPASQVVAAGGGLPLGPGIITISRFTPIRSLFLKRRMPSP